MKKITYNSPVIEVTVWEKADVITTSGQAITIVEPNVVSSLGDSNVTAKISYNEIGLQQ